MSDMVDRVARAIHTLRHNTPEQQARAAIEAMREPTEAMVSDGDHSNGWYRVGEEEAVLCWHAMIDAALSNSKGGEG